MNRRAFLAAGIGLAALFGVEAASEPSVRLHHGQLRRRRAGDRLDLTFEGPGCAALAEVLKVRWPEAMIWEKR